MISLDVLFPVGNYHKYLSQAVESIRKSNGVSLRIIFIDNGLENLNLERYARKDDLVLRASVPGYANALNYAQEFSLNWSPYVAHMNSDDLVHEERFRKQIKLLEKTSAELCICKIQRINSKGTLKEGFYGSLDYQFWHPLALMFGSYGADASWTSTKEWWVRNGFRNADLHPDLVDLELALRKFPTTRIAVDSSPHYFYRSHKLQMSKAKYEFEDFKKISTAIWQFLKLYEIEGIEIETLFHLRPRGRSFSSLIELTNIEETIVLEGALEIIKKIALEKNAHWETFMEYQKLVNIRTDLLSTKGKLSLVLAHILKTLKFERQSR
jgi:glycosyltransferase involved in cell wall biosynthesis